MTTTVEYPTAELPTAAPSGDRPDRRQTSAPRPLQPVSGIVDLDDTRDQHGFLRVDGYLPGPGDFYVPAELIRRHHLRPGDLIDAAVAPKAADAASSRPTKAQPLSRIDRINGRPVEERTARPRFSDLVPLHPSRRLFLETDSGSRGTRMIDLLAPLGKGSRGLIVSPPKAGKTLLLQDIAKAVARNHPECHLMIVLVDERPEEVTDMSRGVDAEVIASTFDRPAREHIALAELAIERAKRLAEQGKDVVILLDSLTRLCRAYNNDTKSGGRILSGGVDAAAVSGPKRLFGAARDLEEAGSVTILATALVDTGSRADDYFFEELKSTGNMELRLDRALAQKRVFPAIDILGSSTRRDDLLMSAEELDAVRRLRRALSGQPGGQGTELLLERIKQTGSNAELLYRVRNTTPTATAA